MEHLTVRPATRGDVQQVLAFILELAEYERLSDTVRATPQTVEAALFSANPVAEAILALWDGEPVGFAVYFTNFSTFLSKPGMYLEDLYVRPSARRRGIGKAILTHLARICVERGYGRLEWAVLDWNTPAIEFYKSLGAVPQDEWTVFRLTKDALRSVGGGRTS